MAAVLSRLASVHFSYGHEMVTPSGMGIWAFVYGEVLSPNTFLGVRGSRPVRPTSLFPNKLQPFNDTSSKKVTDR